MKQRSTMPTVARSTIKGNGSTEPNGKIRATFVINKDIILRLRLFAAVKDKNQGEIVEDALLAHFSESDWKSQVQAAIAE